MKRIALASLLLLAVATFATAASRDSKQSKTVPRAISGVMVGSITWEWDFDVPEGAFPIRSLFDAAGNLKHLGASRMHVEHTPWPGPEGRVTNGEVTITAANGDMIQATYDEGTTETPDPEHMIGHVTFVISGGTGRFAHASGTMEATAFVTALGPPGIGVTWPVTWVLEGTVSY